MPTSVEVLAPPAPPRRPALRAVVTLLLLGLVAWAVVAKLSGGDPEAPATAPPPPQPSRSSQVTDHFAAEVTRLTPALADDVLVLITSLTSFEAWDLLASAHGRSRHQIRRAWISGLDALLARVA